MHRAACASRPILKLQVKLVMLALNESVYCCVKRSYQLVLVALLPVQHVDPERPLREVLKHRSFWKVHRAPYGVARVVHRLAVRQKGIGLAPTPQTYGKEWVALAQQV
eukprot:scaffold81040_cov49-Prasinocladus_malaysianus.AAC.1